MHFKIARLVVLVFFFLFNFFAQIFVVQNDFSKIDCNDIFLLVSEVCFTSFSPFLAVFIYWSLFFYFSAKFFVIQNDFTKDDRHDIFVLVPRVSYNCFYVS